MDQTERFIIQMNIARYREMLRQDIASERRAMIEGLLAEAETNLSMVATSDKQS